MNKPTPKYPPERGLIKLPSQEEFGVSKNEFCWVFCLLKIQPNLRKNEGVFFSYRGQYILCHIM
uniref:Uncharacterized protein n=1 Tax=Kuenenia stuttgartiensis TaxID=174633 RepID=Q1PVQ9_KUEST|nr:unknown protein [Candidatus Kuenenia stuttgartiensis]